MFTLYIRTSLQVETKDRHVDDIRKDLELASIEADRILSDQVDIDMRIQVRGVTTQRYIRHIDLI